MMNDLFYLYMLIALHGLVSRKLFVASGAWGLFKGKKPKPSLFAVLAWIGFLCTTGSALWLIAVAAGVMDGSIILN